MITPGRLDLTVQRWTPFVYLIDFPGIDFSGAAMAVQARLYRDAPGEPPIELLNATPPAQGLFVSTATVDDQIVSTIHIRINETTLESVLLNAGKVGDDVRLVWDLHINGGGFIKTRWLEGSFTIRAGATQ